MELISHKYSEESLCFESVIREWLTKKYNYKKHGNPSWRMLVEAVMDINYDLASKIANAHKGNGT